MNQKTVLITGASNGIGYHTALLLATRYQCRVLALSRNIDKLQQLKSEAIQTDSRAIIIPFQFDLRNPPFSQMQQFLLNNSITTIDVLINNAGLLINKPFESLSPDDWQAVFRINLFGVVDLIRFSLPYLELSGSAHVLNIGSYGGQPLTQKFPGLSAYSSSKGALAILTECLAAEFANRNISINCLSLGTVNTDMLKKAFPDLNPPMQPAQMAELISWFALTGNKFFNGKILPVSFSAT